MPTPTRQPGIVVIGRNEGERLRRCLESVVAPGRAVIYVDSGSTDGSVDVARALGAEVVALDMSRPFSAARGRNAGLTRLLELDHRTPYVQFVDGDCEVHASWLADAVAALEADPSAAAVCGRLRERFPDRSIYNRLCDVEWDAPPGVVRACGGNAMYRVEPLRAAGGFNESVIAGEEPELCYRLRQAGHTIRRLHSDMALHDADMHRLAQWWKRAARGGYALAQGAALHGRGPERFNTRRLASVLVWAMALPLLAILWPIVCAAAIRPLTPEPLWTLLAAPAALIPVLYLALWAKVTRSHISRGRPPRLAVVVAAFTLLAKFAELLGVIRFWRGRLIRRPSRISDFESPAPHTHPQASGLA